MDNLLYVKMDEAEDGADLGEVQTAPDAGDMGIAAEPDGSAELNFEGVNDILSFDPFAEDGAETETFATKTVDETQPDGSETEVTPEPGTTETTAAEETEETKTGETEVESEVESPELVLLRQQIDTQKALIEQMQKGTEATATETAAEANPVPEYAFTIPDAMMNLVDSEDPAERRQGMAAMAQGVAQTVHGQMMEQVQSMFTQVVPQTVMNVVNQQNQAKAIFEDFYGANPELNQEDLKPLVVQVAEAAFKESGATEWSPALRDTIATRVKTILGQGKPAPVRIAAAPASPGGARQSRASNAETPASALANDVGSLLF